MKLRDLGFRLSNLVCILKLRCDTQFQHAFTACSCIFKVIASVSSNQSNIFENATECTKRTLKTRVATQLKLTDH